MTRTLDYIAHEALRTATTYFGPGCHSIKWMANVQGAHKAVITCPVGRWAPRLRHRRHCGLLPSSLPAYAVIDGEGKIVALCHYFKERISDPEPFPDQYERDDEEYSETDF